MLLKSINVYSILCMIHLLDFMQELAMTCELNMPETIIVSNKATLHMRTIKLPLVALGT